MRQLRRATVILAGLAAIALAAGFVAFARGAANATMPPDPHAEGIVVLTGDGDRIKTGLRLLSEGRGTRMLISGVNPVVSEGTLVGAFGAAFDTTLACCVDLDHAARDTIGNAAETRKWVEQQEFTSLLVVTSDYHMQRSMAELADAMPNVALQAVPIRHPRLDPAHWWRDPHTFAVLAREYGKYLLTMVRLALTPSGAAAPDTTAG